MEFDNGLSKAETERLAWLVEECSEVIHVCQKIIRHGFESQNPTVKDSPINRHLLEKEIANVRVAMKLLESAADVEEGSIHNWELCRAKELSEGDCYMHHQHEGILDEPLFRFSYENNRLTGFRTCARETESQS